MCANRDTDFIDEALSSMSNQSYENKYEIVLVANNCHDDLYHKFLEFKKQTECKKIIVNVYRTSIGQLGFNLNYGVDKSLGDYIVRMDSDDVTDYERLKITNEIIVNHDADIIHGSCRLIDESGNSLGERIVNGNVERSFYFKNPIIHPTVAYKKSSFLEVRGYAGGILAEDYDLWLRFFRNKNYKFFSSNEKLISYRIHNDQSRGNIYGPCDCVGYLIREFLVTLNPYFIVGFVFRFMIVLGKRLSRII